MLISVLNSKWRVTGACFLALSLVSTACKNRGSQAKGIDTSLQNLLDLKTVTDKDALRDVCSKDAFILFIGNAEKLGRIVVNPKAADPFEPSQLRLMEQNDAAKERWYFTKIQTEYAALKEKLSSDDPACNDIGVVSKGVLLAILDGPGVGDSVIEVSTFNRSFFGMPKSLKTQRFKFDVQTEVLSPTSPGQTFELLMPRDAPRIITAFRKSSGRTTPYEFGLKIIKGHGVTVRAGGDVGLHDVLRSVFPSMEAKYPLTLLDSQDENGDASQTTNERLYKIPMWSPHLLCRETYGPENQEPYKACLRDTLARLVQGFQISSIGGCSQNRFERLAQGDTKQGDTKQGDTKQGDTKQGDTKQGDTKQGAGEFLQDLSGFDFGPSARQGGKGFAVPIQIADGPKLGGKGPEPSAYRVIGTGLVLGYPAEFSNVNKNTILDLPLRAEQELSILDSCNMDGRLANPGAWFRHVSDTHQGNGSSHNVTDMILLMNPFPVSADAVDYNALTLQQYYFLTASLLGNNVNLMTKGSLPLRQYLKQPPQLERIANLEKRMQTVEDRKYVDPEDVYCSLYAMRFSCNYALCSDMNTYDDTPALGQLDRVTSGFQSLDLINALLVELKNKRDLPEEMIDQLFGMLFKQSMSVSNSFLMKTSVIRGPGAAIEAGFLHPKVPVMNEILIEYFQLLRTLVQTETLHLPMKLDPMRLQFLVLAMQYQKWDQPSGKTVAIAKNFMQENFYDGSYEAFSKASYQKSYTYAKAQGAITESLDHYRARHELAWLKIRTKERTFLELQATPAVTRDALISAFDVVLHAIFYAAQEPD